MNLLSSKLALIPSEVSFSEVMKALANYFKLKQERKKKKKEFSYHQKIAELHAQKSYRPVQVFILYNNNRQFLVVQSPQEQHSWGFPQGGILHTENLAENLIRELQEELGISHSELQHLTYNFYEGKVDFEPARRGERGFSAGKYYFFTVGKYERIGKITANPKEIAQLRWLTLSQVLKLFASIRAEKKIILTEALQRAVVLVHE